MVNIGAIFGRGGNKVQTLPPYLLSSLLVSILGLFAMQYCSVNCLKAVKSSIARKLSCTRSHRHHAKHFAVPHILSLLECITRSFEQTLS